MNLDSAGPGRPFRHGLRWMVAAAIVSLTSAPTPAQETPAPPASGDPDAATVYRGMAGALRKVTSLEIGCKAHFKTEGFAADVSASLLLKEGNKMRIDVEIKGTKDGRPYARTSCMMSNGSTLRVRDDQEPWAEYRVAKDWNEAVLLNITRGGFPTGLELDRIKPGERNPVKIEAVAFFPVPAPAEFVLWKKEELNGKEVIPVEFKLKSNTSAYFRESSVILWVDATNYLPVKRMIVIQSDRTLTVTEMYETVSLNPPLDDARFEVPRGR